MKTSSPRARRNSSTSSTSCTPGAVGAPARSAVILVKELGQVREQGYAIIDRMTGLFWRH